MPGLLSVSEFLEETKEDFNSPTTSTFAEKVALCRQTVGCLEEGLDLDRESLLKMKKAFKAIYNGSNAHVDNELYLSKALERLGSNAMNKDNESDIGAAFIKFSVVTKQLSELMKNFTQNVHNIMMFPVENILKGDLKDKGDLKKPFDKALREYESKISKLEKEKKQQAKEAGFIKNELSPSEIAEEMDKEKKLLQLQMCEYLIKVNEIKTKSGVELLSHLVDYHHAQTSYFQDGLKIIDDYTNYVNELSSKIKSIKQKQDDERHQLLELRNLLRSYSLNSDSFKDGNSANFQATIDRRESKAGYSLHQIQGNKNYGDYKLGYLSKKSEGKMKVKVWQKRKCEVRDGFLYIYHSVESKSPTKVNLLTCQVKPVPDEKKCFDLVSHNRTYHFQADDTEEYDCWVSVLVNSKENALKKEFDSNATNVSSLNTSYSPRSGSNSAQSLIDLRQSIISHILKLPGNDKCVDCYSSKDPTWLSTNYGVLVCIECSGIHRELGVHISRIQSLTLDNIGTSQLLLARVMSNAGLNEIMEAELSSSYKLKPNSSMEERYEFIRAKYCDKKFAMKSNYGSTEDLKRYLEQAILSRDIYQLLEVFAAGADLNAILPNYQDEGFSGLHLAIEQENGSSLHIVDFLVQNSADLNKRTANRNTPLHLCVYYNQSECLKLLLRSGADPQLTNGEGKTPIQVAKEKNLPYLIELLEHALDNNKKTLFDNVNIDWRLPVASEDVSTDFSDDDPTDEKYLDQWQTSGNFNSSPVLRRNHGDSNRNRNSFRQGIRNLSLPSWHLSLDYPLSSLPISAYPIGIGPSILPDHRCAISPRPPSEPESPPIQTNETTVTIPTSAGTTITAPSKPSGTKKLGSFFHAGSIKKKAPNTPAKKASSENDSTTPNSTNNFSSTNQALAARAGRLFTHARTTSDTTALMQTVTQWKNISAELENSFRNDNSNNHRHKSLTGSSSSPYSPTIQRPGFPPPPLPSHQKPKLPPFLASQLQNNSRVSNGQSIENLAIKHSESPLNREFPIPPPRKQRLKRCQAMYDCSAEREDELTFKEGEIILIINEKTDDDDWMEGMIEGEPERRGVFPCGFVRLLAD